MKKITFLLICVCALSSLFAQKNYTFMLTGASFAVSPNGWFEIGCEAFGAVSANKAVSGESIMHTATRMFNGTFYTKSELEAADVFVIMHVHNANVANTSLIKEDYTQYVYTDINNNYANAYDYVIKKYRDDCYKLKDDPESKYYGTENGKSALIVLCTHWHDSRTVYNSAIRVLAERWNFPLVKWDDNIGFTKDVLDEDGSQPSLKYSLDTEQINGITYGWHPLKGKTQYIQQKMAEIFIDELETVVDFPSLGVTAVAKAPVIVPGEEACVYFYFTGSSPWNLEYELNRETFTEENITANPFKVKAVIPESSVLRAKPLSVSNASETGGTAEGDVLISYAQKTVHPFFDTYVHQNSQTATFMNSEILELKTSADNYIREIFISFNLDEFDSDDDVIALRLYFSELIYATTTPVETHLISVAGNNETYTSLNWDNKPGGFAYISEKLIEADEKGSYISLDVSDWLKEQIESGENQVTLLLKVAGGGVGLFRFPSIESTSPNKPVILTAKKQGNTKVANNLHNTISIYPNPFSGNFSVSGISSVDKLSVVSLDGKIIYEKNNPPNELTINAGNFPAGVSLLRLQTNGTFESYKLIKK